MQAEKNRLLTDRWFTIPEIARNHTVQKSLMAHLDANPSGNTVIAAGRRSFKTERFLKRYFVRKCISTNDQVLYLGAPTRTQAKEIFWKDVKALSPKYAIKREPNETELKIEYHGGSTLHVVGLKEFRRVQGGRCHVAGITEFQDCDPAIYTETLEPMLNDTNGQGVFEGRPFGKNHLYEYYLKGVNKLPGWASFHWKSSEILSPEQIARAMSNLTERDYRREYDASFEMDAANPYHVYSSLNNKAHTYNPNVPVIITCDFNATEKPMSWAIGQKVNENGYDVTYWMKVLSHPFTHTKTMCDIADEYLKSLPAYPKSLHFYGDYSGKHHTSNSSYSDWEIIENSFRNKATFETFLKPCLSIRDSIASTNAQLCNALGIRRQFVNPETCKALIDDWQMCEWKDNSRELKDDKPLRGHACRAVDYYNYYEYPITPKTEGKQYV